MKKSFYYILSVGFIIILAGIGAMAFVANQNAKAFVKTSGQIETTSKVLDEAGMLDMLDDANEVDVRNFLATKNFTFLNHSVNSGEAVFSHVDQLKVLLRDNPLQLLHVDSLENAMQQKINLFNAAVGLHKNDGAQKAVNLLTSEEGQRIIGRTGDIISGLQLSQRKYLLNGKESAQKNMGGLNRIFWFLLIVPVVLLFTTLCAVVRGFKVRKKKEDEITELNNTLEQRVAERTLELYNSEKKYHRLFANNPMCMWVVDEETLAYLDVNEAAIKHYGYSRGEFLSMTAFDIRCNDEKERLRKTYGNLSEGPHKAGLWKHRMRNGNIIEVEITGHRIVFEGKNARIILANDITERRVVEAKLEATNRELTNIFNTVDEGLFSMDMTTHQYIHVSKACEKIYGYPLTGFYANAHLWYDVIHPDDKIIVNRNTDVIKRGTSVKMEYRIIHKDGSTRWLNASVIPTLDTAGLLIRLDGIVNDITEQKQAALQIQSLNETLEKRVAKRTAELELANKELESFSYTVSHDLRAPLRVLNGFSKILANEYTGKLDQNGREYLGIIAGNAKQMSDLIDDLLNFSRLGKTNLSPKPVNMTDMVRVVIEEVKGSTGGCKAEIDLHNLDFAQCDSHLIKQVWVNLISNAIKYSGKTAKPAIEIGIAGTNGSAAYYIKDNGAGFDMQQYDKLFTVFHRLHKPSEFEGTGVGLAFVKRIITKHGGKIWAEGKVNQGATFYFTLPK